MSAVQVEAPVAMTSLAGFENEAVAGIHISEAVSSVPALSQALTKEEEDDDNCDWETDDQMEIETRAVALSAYERTAIVVDWDDTLCPSSWAYNKKFLSKDGRTVDYNRLDGKMARQLRKIARRVVRFLLKARTLGPVFIVTAGESGWVESSCKLLLPQAEWVLGLEDICVVSARAWYQTHFADEGTPEEWKAEVFSLIGAESFQSGPASLADPTEGHFHFISIGDSVVERNACHNAANDIPFTVAKTLKFIDRPSITELRGQLEIAHNALEHLCRSETTLDLHLTADMLKPAKK